MPLVVLPKNNKNCQFHHHGIIRGINEFRGALDTLSYYSSALHASTNRRSHLISMNPQTRNFVFIVAGISFTIALLIVNSLISFPSSPLTGFVIRPVNTSNLFTNNTDSDQLNIIAVGDWGCTSQTGETIKQIVSRSPDLVIGLGDYSNTSQADCWLDMVDPFHEKMKIALGEEDQKPLSLLERYMTYFLLQEQYYSFDIGMVHFLALSTETPFEKGYPQYDFAEKDLANAAAHPEKTRWIIVFFHKPSYTSPSIHDALNLFRVTYHPLFEKYGVDLVLQAHNHNYQRSYPILFNEQRPSEPHIATFGTSLNFSTSDVNARTNNTTGPDFYFAPQGTIFLTSGTGGQQPLYGLSGWESYITFQTDSEYGILDITISSSSSSREGGTDAENGDDICHINEEYDSKLVGNFYSIANVLGRNEEKRSSSAVPLDSFCILK